MSSVFRGLDQYCQELQGDLGLLTEVRNAVQTVLGPSSQVLLKQMPNLFSLVGDILSPMPSLDNKEKYNLLFNCLLTFVRLISAPSHPTVVLFDDLQWADNEVLDLITKMIMDAETRSCLFVACYRDDEVLVDHPLLEYLGGIAFAGVPMWYVFQETIGKDVINELLGDALHLSPRITAPLAREMHKKTGGNPHFVKQLLQSLYDERLLQYSPSARRWQWNISAIRSKNIPDNAAALLLERIIHYEPDVQKALQVAALMGRRFDASALKICHAGGDIGGDGSAILTHIDNVIDDGLVCIDKAELRFAHDSIYEAAISLTPTAERESMHLMIGRQMLKAEGGLDFHLELIVDQMNSGSSLIESHDERLRLAELNLELGEQALAAYSFLEASSYLLKGSALLSERDWDNNYRLCLQIFTACAEAQLAHGSNGGATISAKAVISHGNDLKDKLRAHFVITAALLTQGKIEDAAQEALRVLEELGIHLPSLETNIEPEAVKSELEKTESLVLSLRSKDIVDRALHDSDDALIFTMKFLSVLAKICYVKKGDMATLVVCRMVRITMEKAMTSEASVAFGYYSALLCNLGLRDRAAVCARIATALLDRYCGKYSCEVFLALNIAIRFYRQPWHACLDSFKTTSRDAAAIGDALSSLYGQSLSPSLHVFVPVSTLQDAREKIDVCLCNLKSSGHPNVYFPMVYLQALLNLALDTSSDNNVSDPTILRGDADVLALMPQSHMQWYGRFLRKADFARMFLGYVFRRHDVVLQMASNVKEHLAMSDLYFSFDLLLEKFYLGLAAFSIVREGGGSDDGASGGGTCNAEKWRVIADDVTSEMKAMSANDSEWNFQQKFLLLEAEKAFTDGNVTAAAASYDKAINAAKEHRFINEQALASECAALFYLDNENSDAARRYFKQSRDLYQAWGAMRKVEDINSLLENVE